MPKTKIMKHKNRGHRGKNVGYTGGKPCGMNYVDMLQWQKDLQAQAAENAKSELQRVLADRQAQRMEWLYLVALNEKFGFDADQMRELEAEVTELVAEYKRLVEENDQDYADESLRLRVSQIRGYDVRYLYEDQYPVNMDRSCGNADMETVSALREAESKIY